jgi:peptide-methionine (R)-S-oxide reductase
MDEDKIKQKLSAEEYKVLREKGTETPYSGKYVDTKDKGIYKCKVCGQVLFSSEAKLDSSKGPVGLQGWPSFDQALPGAVKYEHDEAYEMNRTEVLCSKCGSHLGHIFDDPSEATGKHYCINSVCLDLDTEDNTQNHESNS